MKRLSRLYNKYNQTLIFLVPALTFFFLLAPFNSDWLLPNISDGIISEATIHLVDVKARKLNFLYLNYLYLLLAFILYFKFRDSKSTFTKSKKFNYQDLKWLPILVLIGFACYAGTPYQFFPDLFESANPTLSIDRINDLQIPFVEYISSHMLSEQVVPVLYDLFHKDASVLDWISWNWVIQGINIIILFFLFNLWFESPLLSFIILLVFPFTQWVIPKEFVVGLLPLFLIKSDINKKNYWLVVLLLLGIVWKLDSGVSAFVATSFTLLFLGLNKYWDFKKAVKPLTYSSLIIAVLFLIVWFVYPPLNDNFLLALDYFSADQAHGRTVLTNWPKDYQFYFHHFVFPFACGYILYKVLLAKKQSFISLSLIYCIPFYFINFLRGLVRHSFTSGTDVHLSSLIYLIFGLTSVWFMESFLTKKNSLQNKGKLREAFLFILCTGISILIFKPGNFLHKKSFLQTGIENLIDLTNGGLIKENWKKERSAFLDKNVKPLKNYLDKHLDPNQTYLDFSNHPLLYHLTERKNPSYFNQFLQNVATVRQQEITIKQLDNFDIPIVLYSYHPKDWLDMTDNVPNALRYHLVHKYIKNQYQPLGLLNNHILWLRNDLNKADYSENLLDIPCQSINLYAGHLPKLLNQYSYTTIENSISNDTIMLNSSLQQSSDMLCLKISGEFDTQSNQARIEESGCLHTITFKTFEETSSYIIPLDYFPENPTYISFENLEHKIRSKELIHLQIED